MALAQRDPDPLPLGHLCPGGQQAFLGTCFQTRFSRVWLPFGVFVEVATADVQILTGTLFLLTMGLVQGGLGLWR